MRRPTWARAAYFLSCIICESRSISCVIDGRVRSAVGAVAWPQSSRVLSFRRSGMGSAAQGSYVGTRLAAELCMTQVTQTRKKKRRGRGAAEVLPTQYLCKIDPSPLTKQPRINQTGVQPSVDGASWTVDKAGALRDAGWGFAHSTARVGLASDGERWTDGGRWTGRQG